MASWLKKTFGKKDAPGGSERPPAGPPASGSEPQQGQGRRNSRNSSTPTPSNGRSTSSASRPSTAPRPTPSRGSGAPRPGSMRVSGHDLNMATHALGVPRPQPPSSSSSQPSTSQTSRGNNSQQSQQDADLAYAYLLAQQEQQAGRQAPLGIPPPIHQHPANPPPGFRAPDLELAAALAESEFSARQAAEFKRTHAAIYEAAVTQAMEASLQTVSYDNILRDIKLWSIDLSAATDDVLAALDAIVRRQEEVLGKLDWALGVGDERRAAKYAWAAEQLPGAEARLRDLAERVAPVGVAVAQLQDLREHVMETSPPLDEAERSRDDIIAKLFRDMGIAGLKAPLGGDEAGPSSGPVAQTPMNIRDLVTSLIDDAQKLPKMPRRRSNGSLASSSTVDTTRRSGASGGEAEIESGRSLNDPSRTPSGGKDLISFPISPEALSPHVEPTAPEQTLIESPGSVDKSETAAAAPVVVDSHELKDGDTFFPAVPSTPLPMASSLEAVAPPSPEASTSSQAPAAENEAHLPLPHNAPSTAGSEHSVGTDGTASSTPTPGAIMGGGKQRRGSNTTTPVPFHLSASRQRSKGTGVAPATPESIRRIPAFVSLHYEIEKDGGVVGQAVAWNTGAAKKQSVSKQGAESHGCIPPAPSGADTFTAQSSEELVEFVRARGGLITSTTPLKFTANDRWTVMCAAASASDALVRATQELSAYEVDVEAPAATECRRLWDYMTKVVAHAGTVTHTHDPLRIAMTKHGILWDEETVPRLRWAAQHAAAALMQHALACAEDAERVRGSKHRQAAVLQALGQAVMATFPIHQLAGGFGGEASSLCDQLVDRTVHYARSIDPKWFRGTRVVA